MPADIGRAVRRFASAIAFVVVLVVVLGAAGCGQRFERASGEAPAPNDLAANALQALEDEGSAHFVADLKSGPIADSAGASFTVRLEGDASATAVDAEGSVSFGAFTVNGRVLVGEDAFWFEVMEQWYGDRSGIRAAVEAAKAQHEGRVWHELATPEGLRRNFDELFDGEVTEGPTVDGIATWKFEGKLDPAGVVALAKRLGAAPDAREQELFGKVAEASRFVLVVGQEDRLPRRLELSVHLSTDELRQLQASGYSSTDGAENFVSTLELSDFGKTVEYEPPEDAKPLDELFDDLFPGIE
jgi:hypothetical protein